MDQAGLPGREFWQHGPIVAINLSIIATLHISDMGSPWIRPSPAYLWMTYSTYCSWSWGKMIPFQLSASEKEKFGRQTEKRREQESREFLSELTGNWGTYCMCILLFSRHFRRPSFKAMLWLPLLLLCQIISQWKRRIYLWAALKILSNSLLPDPFSAFEQESTCPINIYHHALMAKACFFHFHFEFLDASQEPGIT